MRETRRRTFDENAERYAARRPTYPAALYDRMAAYGGLARGARVLEVGPGTGQATRALAERGWRVTAVELGEHLAAIARRHTADQPHVDIVIGSFDDWTLPSEPFDAFFCATAFHWLDPATRVARAAASVRVGGTLAIVWTHQVAGGTPDYFTRTQACYERFEPDAPADFQPSAEERLPPSTDELGASPLVTDVEGHRFPVEITYSTAELLDLQRTYSNILSLPEKARERLLRCLGDVIDAEFGGRVTRRYVFELVLARRAA